MHIPCIDHQCMHNVLVIMVCAAGMKCILSILALCVQTLTGAHTVIEISMMPFVAFLIQTGEEIAVVHPLHGVMYVSCAQLRGVLVILVPSLLQCRVWEKQKNSKIIV